MDKQDLLSQLSADSLELIDEFQLFEEIDSTNAEAIRQLRAGHTGCVIILAQCQTAGRGRRGRNWVSPPGGGVYMSLIRPIAAKVQELQSLSLVAALSVVAALENCGITDLQLKWPNDVLHRKKKLGGILLELHRSGPINTIVFGLGINISLPPAARLEIDRPATDLESILGHDVDAVMIAAKLIDSLCANVGKFEEEGFAPFLQAWNKLDYYRNRDIVIHNGEKKLIGKSLGVDAVGALILQTAEGLQSINGGEVFPSLSAAAEMEE